MSEELLSREYLMRVWRYGERGGESKTVAIHDT